MEVSHIKSTKLRALGHLKALELHHYAIMIHKNVPDVTKCNVKVGTATDY